MSLTNCVALSQQGYGLRKGGQKSSTNPKIVEPLEGIYIHEVTCGYGHTLLIARDEEQDKVNLDKIPVYDPDKVRHVTLCKAKE